MLLIHQQVVVVGGELLAEQAILALHIRPPGFSHTLPMLWTGVEGGANFGFGLQPALNSLLAGEPVFHPLHYRAGQSDMWSTLVCGVDVCSKPATKADQLPIQPKAVVERELRAY